MSKVEQVDLGFRPRAWQAAAWNQRQRFNVIVVHRRGGKTVLAIMWLIQGALTETRPRGRFAYIAPYLKQAKSVAWDYLRQFTSAIPGTSYNESELWVEFPNGSRIRVFGADNPDALRGQYLDGCVLDEVADMRPEVWDEVIRPTLADREGFSVFIGTPKGVNLFSRLYFDALDRQGWFARVFLPDETKALPEDELADAKASMSEQAFRQEFLCDFTAGAGNTLISLEVARKAAQRHLREDEYSFAPKILGVDVARYGNDRTVIFPRQGLAAFKPVVMRGADTMEVAGEVSRVCARWQPQTVFVDADGVGAGVVDALNRAMGIQAVGVHFGSKPTAQRFQNKKAEMWWRMADWLREGAIPHDEALLADLCAPTYTHANAAGRFQIESKEDLTARGLPSPDMADALALTFAFDVAAVPLVKRTATYEYNPFAEMRA